MRVERADVQSWVPPTVAAGGGNLPSSVSRTPSFDLKRPFHSVRNLQSASRCLLGVFATFWRLIRRNRCCSVSWQATDLAGGIRVMSIVTALSLGLFVGVVTTGLVGFLAWRQRMREGAAVTALETRTLSRSTR